MSRRQGFTVLELMLALALAGVVVSAVVGLTGMLYQSERRMSEGIRNTTDMAVAQTIVRRSMNTLVAGAPLEFEEAEDEDEEEGGDAEDAGAEGEDAPAEEEEEDAGGGDLLAELLAGALGSEEEARSMLDEMRAPEVHFELYYEDRGAQGFLPVMEVVLLESPAPKTRSLLDAPEGVANGPRRVDRSEALTREAPALSVATRDEEGRPAERVTFGPTRGVFELQWYEDGLALQWASLEDPYAEPYVLIRDLVRCEWSVLVSVDGQKEWADVWAAYLWEDFPYAVRLTVQTADGLWADWLFETAVVNPVEGI